MMPGIFVCYRREDSSGQTGRIFDRLVAIFGREYIFFDVEGISPGVDFTRIIEERLLRSDTLLAVIGKKWLTAVNDTGGRRISDPSDFVRTEIETALARGLKIVPVLIDGVPMPDAMELPPTISALALIQAIEVSPTRFEYDVNQLLQCLHESSAWKKVQINGWRKLAVLCGTVSLGILAVCLFLPQSWVDHHDNVFILRMSLFMMWFPLATSAAIYCVLKMRDYGAFRRK